MIVGVESERVHGAADEGLMVDLSVWNVDAKRTSLVDQSGVKILQVSDKCAKIGVSMY